MIHCHTNTPVNLLASVPILLQIVNIKMEVQVSNSQRDFDCTLVMQTQLLSNDVV